MTLQRNAQSNNRFENLVSYLLQRYEQAEGNDRTRVIKAIAIYDDPRVIPFALDIVKNGEPHDAGATEALKLLAKRRYEAVVPLVEAIIKDDNVSSQWLLCLGLIGNQPCETIISRYLRDKDTLLRGSAMYAIALIAREEDHALETLNKLIDDPVSAIRKDAINALAVVGHRAIYVLLSLLQSDYRTTLQAITILGEMKAKQAVPHVIPFLLRQDSLADMKLADAAANALKLIGTPSARDALIAWRANRA